MLHRARVALVQRALVGPVVEALDANARERGLHRPTITATAARARALAGDPSRRRRPARLARRAAPRSRPGSRPRAPASPRASAQDRLAELAHLRAGVVDVELALDLVAVEGEQARERVAVGGVARVADVHRPGRVGRDELDEDPLADPPRHPPRTPPRRRAPRASAPTSQRVGEEQVEEARPRHLEALEARAEPPLQLLAEPLRDLARGGAQRSAPAAARRSSSSRRSPRAAGARA